MAASKPYFAFRFRDVCQLRNHPAESLAHYPSCKFRNDAGEFPLKPRTIRIEDMHRGSNSFVYFGRSLKGLEFVLKFGNLSIIQEEAKMYDSMKSIQGTA